MSQSTKKYESLAWRAARFVYRVPIYWRIDRNLLACTAQSLGSGFIFVNKDNFIRCPDDIIASEVFKRMTFERTGQKELCQFLELAKGCHHFVDVGASGGYFSAVFSKTCEPSSSLLSIECDPPSVRVLEQTLERNSCDGVSWTIDKRGISDGTISQMEILSSGYGSEVSSEEAMQHARRYAHANGREVRTHTVSFSDLASICREHNIEPDLLKIDIEGYEHELFQASFDFIAEHRPRIMLELHVASLNNRDKDPLNILSLLSKGGYVQLDGKPPQEMMSRVDRAGVSRATLRFRNH